MDLADRPQRIVLVRHGESLGNVDDTIYERVPDHALELTDRGRAQARAAGERVRELLDGETAVYASPYRRTIQTLEEMRLSVDAEDVRFEPRLREQDWANFQDPAAIKRERELRNSYGHFWYRFNNGESGSDVYDRVSTFLESLFRTFVPGGPDNVVIVTHGLTTRLFCMRWFHWSVPFFESLSNPANGSLTVLERGDDYRYRLREPFTQWNRDVVPTARERSSWE